MSVPLYFRKMGNGQPLLILHGLFGSGDNWQGHARTLSERYEVHIIDQRNHGHSPHDPAMDYPSMVEDLLELIAAEGLRDVILLGHSMGGKTVLHFAQEHPYLVDRMIVVDMGIRAYPPHHDRIFEGLFAAQVDQVNTRKEVEERLSPFVEDPATLQFLMKNLYWKEAGRLAWRFNLPVLHAHISEILDAVPVTPRITVPTLFLKGGRSGYIADADEDAIRKVVPVSTFRTIADAGHWPHAEAPAEFLRQVTEFLG